MVSDGIIGVWFIVTGVALFPISAAPRLPTRLKQPGEITYLPASDR